MQRCTNHVALFPAVLGFASMWYAVLCFQPISKTACAVRVTRTLRILKLVRASRLLRVIHHPKQDSQEQGGVLRLENEE